MEPTSPDDTRPALDRALPGYYVDMIRDGVPDRRKVFGACISIATSAYRRGWTQAQYLTEIADANSGIWTQVLMRRDGRRSTLPQAYKTLRRAWDYGVANANNVGYRDRDEIRADAIELAYAWSDRLDAGTDNLSATERAVMEYVIAQTTERGMFRVTCPGRDVAEHAGIPHRTASRALAALADRGLLVKHSAGKRGEPGKGRAAIYALVVAGGLAHIHGGNTPMCHTEGMTIAPASENTTTDTTPTVETERVAHRDTPGEVAHRDTADREEHFRSVLLAMQACGVDLATLDHSDLERIAWGIHGGLSAAEIASPWPWRHLFPSATLTLTPLHWAALSADYEQSAAA